METGKRTLAIVVMIVTISSIVGSGTIYSQVLPEASHIYYTHDDAEHTIVRSAGKGVDFNTVTCCKIPDEDMSTYSHSFIARDFSLNTAKIIYLPVSTNAYGIMYDQINDMRILGDYCYFCGRRKYMVGYVATVTLPDEPTVYMPEYDSCGIFGYFKINPLATDVSVSLFVDSIIQIKTATRMTVFYDDNNPYQTRVVLLGEPSNNSVYKTCLVNLVNPTGLYAPFNAWSYFIEYLNSSDEVMTDIVATNSYLVTTSIFISDDHLIGFRYIDRNQSHNGYAIANHGDETYVYDLRNFDLNRKCEQGYLHGFVREEDTRVMLTPSGDGYIAGFCGREYRRDEGGLYPTEYGSVFILSMDDPSYIREAQLFQCGFDTRMMDLSFISSIKQVKTLVRSRWHCYYNYNLINAIVTMTLDSIKVEECYYKDVLYKVGGDLLSIDAYKGISLSYSGIFYDGNKPFDGNHETNPFLYDNYCLYTYQGAGGKIGRVEPIIYELKSCIWSNNYNLSILVPWLNLPVETIESEDCPENNQ